MARTKEEPSKRFEDRLRTIRTHAREVCDGTAGRIDARSSTSAGSSESPDRS